MDESTGIPEHAPSTDPNKHVDTEYPEEDVDDLEKQQQAGIPPPVDVYTIHSGRRECRICLGEEPHEMVRACACAGSLSWTHLHCLQRWVRESGHRKCEICKADYDAAYIKNIPLPTYDGGMYVRYLGQGRGDHGDRRQPPARRAWLPIVVTVVILVVLILVIVLIGLNASSHEWASVMLRVLAFSLPTLLVARIVYVYYKARLPMM